MGPWFAASPLVRPRRRRPAATAVKEAFFRRGGGPLQPPVEDGAWLPTVEDIDYVYD